MSATARRPAGRIADRPVFEQRPGRGIGVGQDAAESAGTPRRRHHCSSVQNRTDGSNIRH